MRLGNVLNYCSDERIAATATGMSPGVVTGSEQVSPTQMKAAGSVAAASFAAAG